MKIKNEIKAPTNAPTKKLVPAIAPTIPPIISQNIMGKTKISLDVFLFENLFTLIRGLFF